MKLDNRPDVFKVYTVDLGCEENEGGVYKEEVDSMLTEGDDYDNVCYICGKTANYKLVPKKPELETEYVRKYGYVCENCLQNKYVDPSAYALKKLKDNGNSNMMLV